MQFYAIEIARSVLPGNFRWPKLTLARNRAGLNDWIYEQAHPSKEADKL